jgi:hypothetical protein
MSTKLSLCTRELAKKKCGEKEEILLPPFLSKIKSLFVSNDAKAKGAETGVDFINILQAAFAPIDFC